MKKLVMSAAVGALALLTAACGSSSSGASDHSASSSVTATTLDQLVTAAKKEGEVDVYSTIPQPTLDAFAKAFKAKYGITVKLTRLGGSEVFTRYASERQAGAKTGDIVTSTELGTLNTLQGQGLLAGWSKTAGRFAPNFPKALLASTYNKSYDDAFVQVVDTGFIYNTDDMSAADLPKTWQDLASSKYKGKVCFVPPSASSSFAEFYNTIRAQAGDDVLKKIAANKVKTYPDILTLNNGVAAGECALGLNTAGFFVGPMQKSGAHVAFAHMPSALFPVQAGAVNTEAAHPNAATLFLYFITAPEGNKLINSAGSDSFGSALPTMPKGFAVTSKEDDQKATTDLPTLENLMK